MNEENLRGFIDNIVEELNVVENELDVMKQERITIEGNINNVQNFLYKKYEETGIDGKVLDKMFYTLSKHWEKDERNYISIEDIKPTFYNPLIVYNGGVSIHELEEMTNQKVENIDLNNYFISMKGDNLRFIVDNTIHSRTYRYNKYRPEYRNNVIGNMKETYELEGSTLKIIPDYRGTKYEIKIYAVDEKNIESVSNYDAKQYLSDYFKFVVIEKELPKINVNENIIVDFGKEKISKKEINLEIRENIYLDIDYDEDIPLKLEYSTRLETSLSNIELNYGIKKNEYGESNLVIEPNYRGINGEDLIYDIIVEIREEVYDIYEELKVSVIEPSPIKRRYEEEPYYLLSNNSIELNIEELFISKLGNELTYTISSEIIPYEIESKILKVRGNYRGIYENREEKRVLNKIEVIAIDNEYISQKVKINVNIEEYAPPPPKVDVKEINLGELTIETIECNLNNYFSTISGELYYEIIGFYDNSLIRIDTSNIIIETKLREIKKTNEIFIRGIDKIYEIPSTVIDETERLRIEFKERATVEKIKTISEIRTNNKEEIIIDLNEYYKSPIKNELSFFYETNKYVRNDKIIQNLSGIEIINSNLHIRPDYRNDIYTISLYGYDEEYINYRESYIITFNLIETQAPSPKINNYVTKQILRNIVTEIDMTDKFVSLLNNVMSYEIVNGKEWISIQGNNVVIEPNLRDINYVITVRAKDIIYEVYSEENEYLSIEIEEKHPVRILKNIENILNLGNEKEEILLKEYFESEINTILSYNLEILTNEIRKTYIDDKDAVILDVINDKIEINPDYRDTKYKIRINAYDELYVLQKKYLEFEINENRKTIIEPNPDTFNIDLFEKEEEVIDLRDYYDNRYFSLIYKIENVENKDIEIKRVNIWYNEENKNLYFDNEFRRIVDNVIVGVEYHIMNTNSLDIKRNGTIITRLSEENHNYFTPQNIGDIFIYNSGLSTKEIQCISQAKKRIKLWYENKKLYYVNELDKRSYHILRKGFQNIQYHIINTDETNKIKIRNPSNNVISSLSNETGKVYFELRKTGIYTYTENDTISLEDELFESISYTTNVFYIIKNKYLLYFYNMGDPQSPKRLSINCYDETKDQARLFKLNTNPLIINKPEQTVIDINDLGYMETKLNMNNYLSIKNLENVNVNIDFANVKDVNDTDVSQSLFNITYNSLIRELTLLPDYRNTNYKVNFKVIDPYLDYGELLSEIRMNIYELAPIEINSNTEFGLIDLTLIGRECNLEDLFVINVPNSTKSYNDELIKSNNVLNDGVYNLLKPYERIENILYINPEYRNIEYELKIELYVTEYPNYKLSKIININEIKIPELILDDYENRINIISDLKIETIECNLSYYFKNYPYNEYLDFSCNIDIENTDIKIENNSLKVNSDLRGITYEIEIIAKDLRIENNINNNLKFIVSELEPLEINSIWLNKIYNVGRDNIEIDVRELFIRNYELLNYEIDVISSKEYKLQYSNVSNIEYDNNNFLLKINSEYANENYKLTIIGNLENYKLQTKTIEIIIEENEIPQLIFNEITELTYLNVIETPIIIDIDNYFNNYPYLDKLNIEFKFTPEIVNENSKEYNYIFDDLLNVISIFPDVRDMYYEINVILYDEVFNQMNSNMIIKIQEEKPVKINELTSIPEYYNIYNETKEYDLNDLFIANLNQDIIYDIEYVENGLIKDIPIGILNNIPAFELINSNILKITGDFRNRTYYARIKGYLEGYESQKTIADIKIVEEGLDNLIEKTGEQDIFNNLKYTPLIIDLYNYYLEHPLKNYIEFTPILLTNIETERRKYEPLIENNSNLLIRPNINGYQYQIKIKAIIPGFNLENSNVILTFEEESIYGELRFNQNGYILEDLSTITFDISRYYIEDYKIFEIEYNNYIPRQAHYIEKNVYELNNGSNLTINPEYRDDKYELKIISKLNEDDNDCNVHIIKITECNIPEIIYVGETQYISDLTKINIDCNVSGSYIYPFVDKLIYSCNFIDNIGEIQISEQTLITIIPDLRNTTYNVSIEGYDPAFNKRNNEILFVIQEKAPIEYKENDLDSLTKDLGKDTSIVDLRELFIKNWEYELDFTIKTSNLDNVEEYYRIGYNNNGKPLYELINNELIIYPEYRGENRNYIITIEGNLIGYEWYKLEHTFIIEESNIPEIILLENNVYFTSLSNNDINVNIKNLIDINYPYYNNLSVKGYPTINLNVTTINNDEINFKADVRGIDYTILIEVYDIYYREETTKCNLTINVNELLPIYNNSYSEIISNLTNIDINCNLDQYFRFSIPELPKTYTYDIKGYKDEIETIIPIGNYNGGRDVIELNQNILTIVPEYRKQFIDYYDVNINVILGSYTEQSNNYSFRIYEERIPELIEDIQLKSIKDLSNVLYIFENVKNIYSSYPYQEELILSCNIYEKIEPDEKFKEKNFIDFRIEIDNSDVKVYPNVRGITYYLRITANDNYFEKENSNIIFEINEKYPVYIGELIDEEGNDISLQYLSLSNITVDLNGNYIKSIPEYELEYEILYVSDPRKAIYLPKELQTIPDEAIYEPYDKFGGKKYNDYRSNAIYVEEPHKMTISPEYRGESYYVTIRAILKDPLNIYDYTTQCNIQSFQVNENDIPNINIEEAYKPLSNNKLTNLSVTYDLWRFYKNYPFYLDLGYEVKIIAGDSNEEIYEGEIPNDDYYEIDEEYHTLMIKPRFRENYYALYVNAYDINRPSNSNNELMIKVSEESLGDGIPEIIYLGHIEANFNMYDYVIDKTFTFEVYSEPTPEEMRDAYYKEGKAWEFKNGSNLVFNPEYRNIDYTLTIIYIDNFGTRISSNVSEITEREIQPIKANDKVIIPELKTTNLSYDLDDLYNYDEDLYFASDQPTPYYSVNYPLRTFLEFEVLPINVELYEFDNSNTLTLKPDVRGINYEISIISRDSNFNLYSSNVLFNVTELFPIDRIQDYNDVIEDGYEKINDKWNEKVLKIDLEEYYQINHENINCNLNYNIYSNEILIYNNNEEKNIIDKGIYSDKKQIELIDSNLYIRGDYRNTNYKIRVDSYLENYSNIHTISHITQDFEIIENEIPKIELKSEIECNIYNEILTERIFDTSLLYDYINYPLWCNVSFYTENTGDEILDRVNIDKNTGILEINSKLLERSKEYTINIIVKDDNERFNNSCNSEYKYNIHELGKIIDISTISDFNETIYGYKIISLENVYNIFQYENFIKDDKKYDEIIDFIYHTSNIIDIEYINTNTTYYSNFKPELKLLTDVRGINYEIILDLSYKNNYDVTSNLNVKFNVIEKTPLEYFTNYTRIEYISDTSLNEDIGIYKQIPTGTSNIINLDELFINNNNNSNIRYEIVSVYSVNEYTNYPEYISKYLMFYNNFITTPLDNTILTNTVNNGINGIIINGNIELLDLLERKEYPDKSTVKSYIWNNNLVSTSTYIQIDNLIKNNENVSISYWFKNYDNGINCNILFELENVLSIYTENNKMKLNINNEIHFENEMSYNSNEWTFYTNSIEYTTTDVEYKFYINTLLQNIQTNTLPILSDNINNFYIGKYIQDKISLGDIRIYNGIIEDGVISNLYYGVRDDNIFDENYLRITRPDTKAYSLSNNELTIDTDFSGKTYDLTIKSYLENYQEYQELYYTFRIKEDEFTHNFTDGGTIQEVDMRLTLDMNYDSLSNQDLINDFETSVIDEISLLLNIDSQYLEITSIESGSIIVNIRIKPDVFNTTSPAGYAIKMKEELYKNRILEYVILKFLKAVTVTSPISLEYNKEIDVRYDPFNIDILTTINSIEDINYTIIQNSIYENISLINSSNIHIIPQARNENYLIKIFGEKTDENLNVNINLNITELAPQIVVLDKSINSNINPIVIFKEIDLISYYPTYERPTRLKFDIISEYQENLVLTNDNKLQITGTISGKDYDIQIIAYDEAIPKYQDVINCNLYINVKEVIPISISNDCNIYINDLILDIVDCNLTSYFNFNTCNYPTNILKYDFTTSINYSNISIKNESIIINPDVRDNIYDINITLYYVDEYSNILHYTSNNELTIKVHEKAPLEIDNTIFFINDLTNIQNVIDLSSKIDVNNLPQYNLKYTSNFPELRLGYYNGELDALEVQESNLIINPEYRNETYIAKTEVYVEGYYEQRIELTFNIEECNIPSIIFIPNDNLSKSNLIKEIETYDLRDYFSNYPYVDKLIFTSNILTPLEEGRHNYNVNIENESNLIIEADVRDQYYEIEIMAYDINFNGSNEEMKVKIQEEKPLYYKYDSNSLYYNDLEETSINIEFTSYFTNIVSGTFGYNININCNLRQTFGDNKDAIEINNDILTINPDYRNETYIVKIDTYIIGYENQSIPFVLNIEECNVISFELLSPSIELISLTRDNYTIDLRNKFNKYQFVEFIDFYYTTDDITLNGRKPLNIELLDTSNLKIDGDLRDIDYRINVLAIHPELETSNTNFYIDVSEKAPISVIYSHDTDINNEYIKTINVDITSGWKQIDGIDWI